MFDSRFPASGSAAPGGATEPQRVMKIAPLDLRQQRFKTTFRGFEKSEVVAFLTEAADDYEQALREIDRLRQDLVAQRQHGEYAQRFGAVAGSQVRRQAFHLIELGKQTLDVGVQGKRLGTRGQAALAAVPAMPLA